MLGCLKAFLKSSVERRFYDLGRVGFIGSSNVDFKLASSNPATSRVWQESRLSVNQRDNDQSDYCNDE